MDLVISPGNDTVAQIEGAFNQVSRRFVNGGSGSIIIRDQNGAQVTGVSWPILLAYVANSRGVYRGIIPAGGDFIDGKEYEATISIAQSGGPTATWTERIPARLRA